MKKTLLFNFNFNLKYLFALIISVGVSLNSSAQEKNKEISSPEKSIPKSTELEKSEIITFPIKAKGTTDPNYEINKQKSLDTQKRFDTSPSTVIKDDKYFLYLIEEYKRRIKEIEDNSDSPSSNSDKLEGLKSKLENIQQEYLEYKKSKVSPHESY